MHEGNAALPGSFDCQSEYAGWWGTGGILPHGGKVTKMELSLLNSSTSGEWGLPRP
jgi:hypothetical protein